MTNGKGVIRKVKLKIGQQKVLPLFYFHSLMRSSLTIPGSKLRITKTLTLNGIYVIIINSMKLYLPISVMFLNQKQKPS